MKHLSPSELVDYVDGALDRERASHVHACDVCRREAEMLRVTMQEASAADVPEPSPLFWEHFSSRVWEEISKPPARTAWLWAHPRPLVAAAAALLLVAIVFASRPPAREPIAKRAPAFDQSAAQENEFAFAPHQPAFPLQDPPEPDDDIWRMLEDAAGDLRMDDARAVGFAVRPGAIDGAVLKLSPRERAELARLIQDEIRQTPRFARRGMKELL
jgi:hypothetical protein